MSLAPTSINKITPPCVSGVLPRTRLFQRMDKALEKPLVWIRGPGGSGKSSLAASYLASRNLPHIWYRVDEGDSDCATLFYYMGLAVQAAAPDNPQPLPLLTREYQPSLPVFARRYFEHLFNRLSQPFVIVFDDYQEVAAASPFHDVICKAAEEIPFGIKIVVISKDDPPPSLARFRSRRMLGLISWEDLRLSAEELREVVQLHNEISLDGKALDQLLVRTQGWVAGVALLLERGITSDIPRELARQKAQAVFDYFAMEVFGKAEAAIQDFLLKTAFLIKFTPIMAYRLTGNSAAGPILDELYARHFFTEKCSTNEATYQYHPLFREFLSHRAHEIFPDDYLVQIKQVSAELLMANGQAENAAELFIAAGDWTGISRLVRQEAPSLIAQGRHATIETWIAALPCESLAEEPWLEFWLGVCKFNDSVSEARGLFESSLEQFKAHKDVAGIYLAWSGIANSFHHEMENWHFLDHWIAVLDELMSVYPVIPSQKIETRLAISMFTSLVLRQTDHQRIDEWGKRMLALLENSTNSVLRMKALYSMLLHHFWRGNYAKMRLLFDSAGDNILLQQDVSPLETTMLKSMKAYYYWLTAQPDLCRQIISDALETAGQTGVHLMDTRLRICLAQAELIEDNPTLLEKCWNELKSFHPQDNKLDETNYHFCSAMLAMHKKRIADAACHLEEAEALVVKIGSHFHECLWHIGTAQVLFAQANAAESLSHLAKAQTLSLRIKSSNLEFICLLTTAAVLFRQGNDETGLQALRRAMALGRENDYIYGMWWDARMVASLCVKALESGIEMEYVQKLVWRRHLIPDELPLSCKDWPWPIRVYTLGDLYIVVDGKPLQFSGKVQKKPLELIKALIGLGGAERSVGQLADLLWPEADGDTAKNSLKITLHRLRQIIGHEDAIELREGKLTIDLRLVWSDVSAFEQLLDAAQIQGDAGAENEAVRLTERALALYRGHFLEGDGVKPWVTALRARVKKKFVLNTVAMSNLYQKRGARKKALDCLLRGLEMDPHAEEIYQSLMQCNIAAGLRAEAVAAYRSCKLALAEVGIAPSARTESIYKTALAD